MKARTLGDFTNPYSPYLFIHSFIYYAA